MITFVEMAVPGVIKGGVNIVLERFISVVVELACAYFMTARLQVKKQIFQHGISVVAGIAKPFQQQEA
jgi:hypothetical protein